MGDLAQTVGREEVTACHLQAQLSDRPCAPVLCLETSVSHTGVAPSSSLPNWKTARSQPGLAQPARPAETLGNTC
jgi:hypothetical protein